MEQRELEEAYRAVLPRYEEYAQRLHDLLQSITASHGMDVAQIEHRAKSVESFLAKAQRKGYEEPLSQTKDLAGLRITTYYEDDVGRVVNILREEFEVHEEHSVDKLDELRVDEFGYRSVHLVVKLGESRTSLPEWKDFADLDAEIQIRSVLQHAWAAISHKIAYKEASEAPGELRRQLVRLSALLELADQQFALIRDRSEQIAEDYRADVREGELDIPLDIDSLSAFLRERADVPFWARLGRETGLSTGRSAHPVNEREVAVLLHFLVVLHLSTISEFECHLSRSRPGAKENLVRFAAALKRGGVAIHITPLDVLTIALAMHLRDPRPWEGLPAGPREIVMRAIMQPPSREP